VISQVFSKEEARERIFHGYEADVLDLRKGPSETYIILEVVNATQELQKMEQDGFSYERWASKIFKELAPGLRRFKENRNTKEQDLETLNYILGIFWQIRDSSYLAEVLMAFPPDSEGAKEAIEFAEKEFPLSPEESSYYHLLLRLKIQKKLPWNGQDTTFQQLIEAESPYRKTASQLEASSHKEALQGIRKLTNSFLQTKYLQQLIPNLEPENCFEAVSIIGDIQDIYHQASTRIAIAQRFPGVEFFEPALSAIEALASQTPINLRHQVQAVELLSILALKTPDILPKMIRMSEDFFVATEAEGIDTDSSQQISLAVKVARHDILTILAPHLPIRINNEVVRERSLGRFASKDLYQRSLFLLKIKYRKVLKNEVLRNDADQAKDLLNLKSEINSLSGLLLRRELEPPMTLAIFGSWGSGKSYIMHLMQECMTEIRSRPVSQTEAWSLNSEDPKLSPFVGHIYQIRFDAWTFAQSDLWASLMQTIFFELDRQLTLESAILRALDQYKENALEQHKLAFVNRAKEEALKRVDDSEVRKRIEQEYAFDQRKGKELLKEYENRQDIQDEKKQIAQNCENKKQDVEARIWPVLYKSNNEEREWFLNRVLQDSELLDLMESKPTQGGLWQVIDRIQKKDKEKLRKIRLQLDQAQNELDKKRAQYRQDAIDEFEPILNFQKNQQVRRIDALFGTSFEILRRRIGPKLFLELNKQVHVELYGPASINQDGMGKPTQASFNSALEFLRSSGSGNNIDNTSTQNNTSTPQEPITDSTQKAPAEVDKGLWGKLNNLLADVEDAKEKLRCAGIILG
jgi:hypothetical protein